MHINQIRNLPCPAPSPSVQSPPRPGPRYSPEPEAQPPAPRLPSGHRLDTHLPARARGPRPRRPPADKEAAGAPRSARLARPGATRDPPPPGPPAGAGRAERRWVAGHARAGTPGAGAARCSPLLAPSSLLPPFPSFCYLDFFSCCVMSIIYANRFAACCTSRASRRGRRSGKGGGVWGAADGAWGWGGALGDPQAPPGPGPRACGAA